MAQVEKQVSIQVGPQGRVVIPAEWRRALNISPGDSLVARIEDGRIVLETRENVIARIRKRFENAIKEPSVVDELIAERREEARREEARREEADL